MHAFHERPLHAQKMGVWCVILQLQKINKYKIIGPIFFEYTITADQYQNVLLKFITLLGGED